MKKKRHFYFFIKRLFDIVSSFLMILLLSWLMIILLIINVFAAKGNPLYLDKRVGKNGSLLKMPKFRTMYFDANKNAQKYLSEQQYQQWKNEGKVDDDPRITKFGKFLRKSSLDELPQLFSIFLGKLSVVGPRPVTQRELDKNYTAEEVKKLLSTRPGLLSNWAVNGRNDVLYEDGARQRLELEYLDKQSVGYDLKTIFKSIGVVFSGKGAK